MKYFEIIYTSSQKGLNGSNGFGIRTATEGTPREYLEAVLKNTTTNQFANVITDCKVPSPSEVTESEGAAIRRVPPRYFFQPIEVASGRRILTLGRNVYLGFTESFYSKDKDGNVMGKSGRMGNYLIHMFLFEDTPSTDVFQLLYESPADGSNRFVPSDPSPRKDNAEMAALSVGDPVMLPAVTRPFRTGQSGLLSPQVVDLLLAIIDAKLTGKQLVVKYPWQSTPGLIADAFQFLPTDHIGDFTFSTNYTGNGFNAPANILFVNEFYKAQYVGKGIFADFGSGVYQADEAKAFRKPIEDALRQGDFLKVHKLIDWILSPAYQKLGNVSANTKGVMFLYREMPSDFRITMVDEAKNRDELVGALARDFKLPGGDSSRFVNTLIEKIDNASDIEEIIRAVQDIEYYTAQGIDMTPVIADQKAHINAVIMSQETPHNAHLAIDHLGLTVVRKYTNNLKDGLEREDLAIPLFEILKENVPTRLQDVAAWLSQTRFQNQGVYKYVLQDFSSLFSPLYQSIISHINSDNKGIIRQLLNEELLQPLQSEPALLNNSLFQKVQLLDAVLSDNETVLSANNFKEAAELVCKMGLMRTKVGQTIKGFFFNYATPQEIAGIVAQLKNQWRMTTDDIIRQSEDSPIGKNFIKSALEDSGYQIEQVLSVLSQQKFTDHERDIFLSGSPRYKAAYASYRRKKLFGGLFSAIFGIFKRNPKPTKEQSAKVSANTTPKRQAFTPKSHSCSSVSTLDPNEQRSLIRLENHLERNVQLDDELEALKCKVEQKISECRQLRTEIPEPYRRFEKYVTALLLLLSLTFFGSFTVSAQGYHAGYGDIKDAPKCYIVSAKTLNVRTTPSLYKGKRKTTKRKDNIGFQLSQGDTIFTNALVQPTTIDGVDWIEFTHNGTSYYTDITKLYVTNNPRVQHEVNYPPSDYYSDGFIGWLQGAAPWILLVLTLFVFCLSFGFNTPDKDSLQGEIRDDTGMRPMFMYSLRPYQFFTGLSLRLLIGLASSIVIMLIIGGIVWGLLWLVKILMWALIVIGWICLIVGILGLFGAPALIPLAIVGGIIVYYKDSIEAFGNECVETGMEFFNALNMWEFACDLIQTYWIHALVISLIPLLIFLIAAILMMVVAWCLRGYEAFTTHRYNVKHPCPRCHEPSEPAEYYDETTEGERHPLPTPLRPGIYGLLHITHPVTGNLMPTLIANGRDSLLRKCPHCGLYVNFEAGTEKHIGFIGMPASGKTSLLCNVIGLMMKVKPEMHFTNTTDENILEIQGDVDFAKSNGHLDFNHLPPKTGANWRASIQCILPRTNGGLPYHLYFNDVAGELFTAGGNDKNLLRFSQDVENIVFIIDPWTMKLNDQKVSDRVKKWLKTEEVELMREGALEEALNAFDSLVNALQSSNRDFSKINLAFAFVKSDTGYLEGVNIIDESALKLFMKEDLKLGNIIHAAETRFLSVSYIAVNVFQKEDRGVQLLCDKLLQQLEIE